MLASRLSLVIIFLMGFVYLLYWIITERRYKVGLGLLGSVLILIFIMAIAMPKTVKRFKSIANTSYSFENMRAENHFNKEISPENWNGLTLRLAIWTCALEVVEKHPSADDGGTGNDWKVGQDTIRAAVQAMTPGQSVKKFSDFKKQVTTK